MTGSVVDALILEAPYTSMTEAATVNPLATVRPPYTDSSPLGILVFTIQRYVLCVFRNTKHFYIDQIQEHKDKESFYLYYSHFLA